MKVIISVALIASVATLALASAPGQCPSVTTTTIVNMDKMMGLWWRPFRSRFSPEEPLFKCLSTEWSDLVGNKFKVIDNNVDAFTNEKSTWTGMIETLADPADWKIVFDHGFKVSAQVLDVIEDKYIFMYVCNMKDDGTHDENGIIFTREKNVAEGDMNNYMNRASEVMKSNGLKHISMMPIFFSDCPN